MKIVHTTVPRPVPFLQVEVALRHGLSKVARAAAAPSAGPFFSIAVKPGRIIQKQLEQYIIMAKIEGRLKKMLLSNI